MALMLSIMAGMLHDMLYSFGRPPARAQEFIFLPAAQRRHGNLRRPKAWTRTMFSKLKAAWARMTGGRAAGESDEPNTPAIEYQGYRIPPTPHRTDGHDHTAGIHDKNFPHRPA